ncbi:unnamed protein product [Sphenostylis stenocarpa]|uniref:Uncharacterized GPI-anchored protein At5g19230-like domain-containing protein n=1 Tax=Sphenostylis stenocarpa TaxID=92480 RepID=A0AA86V836_9FABA|nr:unnamed protein product [Sphenostylis stenocarpa]
MWPSRGSWGSLLRWCSGVSVVLLRQPASPSRQGICGCDGSVRARNRKDSFFLYHLPSISKHSLSLSMRFKLQKMALSRFSLLFTLLLFVIVKCDHDEEDNLYQQINNYRKSLNLASLTKNENAKCFADEMVDQFKDQPCTNSTGANTVPGTEPRFSNYPDLLNKCHLNISNTRDGAVMPACVPGLAPSVVLTNFTQSLYSGNLNDSKFTGVGIGSDDNWIVVVLTTNTPEGSFVPETSDGANLISKFGLIHCSMFLLVGKVLLL